MNDSSSKILPSTRGRKIRRTDGRIGATFLFAVVGTVLCLGSISSAEAKEVVVPYAANLVTAEGKVEIHLRVSNDSTQATTFSWVFIARGRDGTAIDRSFEAQTVDIGAHQSLILTDLVPEGEVGYIEVSGDDDLIVSARMVILNSRNKERIGDEIPILSETNVVGGLKTANLIGLRRLPEAWQTDFYLLNLGSTPGSCGVQIYRRGGQLIFDVVIDDIPPLGMWSFTDAFKAIGRPTISEARFAVTCSQASYPFAIHRNLSTADALIIKPSTEQRSGFDLLVDSFPCPSDALFYRPGIFHTVEKGNETKSFVIPQQGGQVFDRLILDMTFIWGGYYAPTTNLHNIFWLQRNDIWTGNVFGYLNAQGAGRNQIKLETNVDLARNLNSTAQVSGTVLDTGRTYLLHYEYDAAGSRIETTITTKSGETVASFVTTPTVDSIQTIDQGWYFQVSVEAGAPGPENPTYGTKYGELCFQLR